MWATYGVVHYAASIPAILPEERQAIAIAKVIRALTGLVISSLLVPLLRSQRDLRHAALGIIAGASAMIAGFTWMFLDRVVLVTVAVAIRLSIPWERFVHGMDLDYLFVMIAWVAAYVGLMLYDYTRAQREELLTQQMQMQGARLSLLAAQLNPHFLFNSLNTIKSLAAEDATRTREVVGRLSSFLRRVISFDAAGTTSVKQEIVLAGDYLAIERARFESRLSVRFEVDPAAETCLVPPLILQPLLENSIKHGEPGADGIRRVVVSASMKGSDLLLQVENTGSLSVTENDGVGIALTRSRLDHSFAGSHSFDLSQAGDRVIARIRIDGPVTREASGGQA